MSIRELFLSCIDAQIATYRSDVLIYVRGSIAWGDQCAYPALGHTMANEECDQCDSCSSGVVRQQGLIRLMLILILYSYDEFNG